MKKKRANVKKDLEDKIKELEKKLSWVAQEQDRINQKPDWMKPEKEIVRFDDHPVGKTPIEIIRAVAKAKKNSEQRAGLLKSTASGSTMEEDNVEARRIPKDSIHYFENLEECLCACHPSKKDCMNCYDHPEHLAGKVKKVVKPEYDEASIMKLIEEDKAKKDKKSKWDWLKK